MASKDLRLITDDWEYEPGQINVRKIRGADNRIKIQMRVDLGVLQMEVDGRPDGRRPHQQESLLEYHSGRIEAHRRRNGSEQGYVLTPEECREVREEAFQYYQRYLANFVLEDFEAVVRDTKRNLDVLDLCVKYAEEDDDRYSLEQYRPYVLMMHYRSKALGGKKKRLYRQAMAHVECGLRILRSYFVEVGQPRAYKASDEVKVLKALRRDLRRYLPVDPVAKARKLLDRAVAEERYEDAAKLRDQLDALIDSPGQGEA